MIRNDDIVLDSLRFEQIQSNSVVNMSVYDWNTSAYASESFPSYNASKFVGKPQGEFFTGLMTEWHVTTPSTVEAAFGYSIVFIGLGGGAAVVIIALTIFVISRRKKISNPA
ncbi:MAG: hypothetical protein JRN15_20585 [Nitrososphaerota archaeon]|nr:hypothetical protein [Nitrososphaerota archaeon]